MSRRRHQNVLPADRQRLISAFEGRDHIDLADMLGVARLAHRELLLRGGNRSPLLNDVMHEELILDVEETGCEAVCEAG